MYSQKYRRNHEFTNMSITIKNTPDTRPQPPLAVQIAEEGTPAEQLLARLLREAVTPEEHVLLLLLDELVDEEWRLPTGKALRGELRRTFLSQGYSTRRFYVAFHNIEKRFFA
jgi:hypothetical protein